ncbi:hypothetical protein J1N35_013690 [Gossypium stocksii]|uniref:Leucine-rich repeat-containing N-terminal plant-type domain-containing protein n=1 Tax=Gossypium stocksii TaxID=47602 RepID=A0A9D4A8L6_9ROSI|nr:hypothetical protein J1N35_013690 [Gossypium stocksii]
MGNNKLNGKIPEFIGDLKDLRILLLESNSFYGSIPEEINALENLQFIGFSNNQLSGPIPEKLSGLKTIINRLKDGNLLGFIISQLYIGVQVNLVAKGLSMQFDVVRSYNNGLDLSCNNLTGNLPSELGHLQGLYALNLSHNRLSGNFPIAIGNMSLLESLDLSYNNLSGEIPVSLTLLDPLSTLNLAHNNPSGEIPTSPHFDTLSRDGLAYIGNKFLCGAPDGSHCDREDFPTPESSESEHSEEQSGEWKMVLALAFAGYVVGFWGLFGVVYLVNEKWRKAYWASVDRIVDGIIRCRKIRLENIQALDLSANNFTGNVPTEVGLGNIRYLALSDNKLSGRIPFSLCQENGELMLLYFSNNNLFGTIPTSFGNYSSLVYLNLGSNNLTGGILEELQGAKRLSFLNVSGNHFDGSFPSVVRRLERISIIDIGNNKLSGKIPKFIGDLKDLRILLLEFNSFNGSIPEEINALENLAKDRNLLGFIISRLYIGVRVNLVAKGLSVQFDVVRSYNNGLDLSCNNLTRNLPSELGHLQGLYALNLSYNCLSGNIPTAIRNMSLLESLNLSYNNLSGEIPISLDLLDPLSTLNFAHNNLSGEIPTSLYFDTLRRDGLAYIGNKFLCGAPDGIHCDSEDFPTPESSEHSEEQSGEWKMVLALAFAGYIVGFWGLFEVVYLVNEK